MKTLPEGSFRKAASGTFMTYLFPVSFCLWPPPFFSPQHCEESQLKRTCGNSHAERFRRLQGQSNSCRIHRQQFQRQKKWQVSLRSRLYQLSPFSGSHIHLCSLTHQKRSWSPYEALLNQKHTMVYLEAGMTAVCLLIYFAANRGIQCSMQVRR